MGDKTPTTYRKPLRKLELRLFEPEEVAWLEKVEARVARVLGVRINGNQLLQIALNALHQQYAKQDPEEGEDR